MEKEKQEEKVKFVTLTLSKKQVDFDHPTRRATKREPDGKDYVRVFAPRGGVFFYPAESFKEYAYNPNKVYFSRPEGTELLVYYSKRREDVPDSAPNAEKYESTKELIKIEDIKAMYEQERRDYLENNSPFVNMTIPTEWGKTFTSKKGDELISISIPIQEETGRNYYEFILPADRVKQSEKDENMSYFGFLRKTKDGEDYMVSLKRSVKSQDNTYDEIKLHISSTELKKHVEAAKDRYYLGKDHELTQEQALLNKSRQKIEQAEKQEKSEEAEQAEEVKPKPQRKKGR